MLPKCNFNIFKEFKIVLKNIFSQMYVVKQFVYITIPVITKIYNKEHNV